MKKAPAGQMALGLAVAPIQRCVSMCRVEVFVPAEIMDLPEFLAKAFEDRMHDLNAERVETVSVYGLDLPRDLRREETTALEMAREKYGIWHRIFRR